MGKLTYEDYCLLPNDGRIHEIINGEHYNHPLPTTNHQRIARRLEMIVGRYVERTRTGEWFSAPLDVLLGKFDVVQPDKIFISKENKQIVTQLNIQGAPDLLVEIISTDALYDKRTKLRLYERRGVKHYWIIDPQSEALYAYKLVKKKYKLLGEFRKGDIFRPELFPALKIRISEIFPRGS